MIKVVICDGNGTLGLPKPSTEHRNLINKISSLKMKIAVASNKSRSTVEKAFTASGLTPPNIIVTPEKIRRKKPKPEFVYEIQKLTNVELNEIAYVGDSDETDIFCAINAKVLPIAARYADPNVKYGMPFSSVMNLQNYLEHFGQQSAPYFGWSFSSPCKDTSKKVEMYSLLGQHHLITESLKSVFKSQNRVPIGPRSPILVAELLFYYFISQCFLSGQMQRIEWVTVYPGHTSGSSNPILAKFSKYMTGIFRNYFLDDLIIRHKDAPKSQFQGGNRKIIDQFKTVLINKKYESKIRDKVILVLDDFTTCGYSLETARRMLLQCGAKHVVGLAIGKFGATHSLTTIHKSWDPFAKSTLSEKDIKVAHEAGIQNSGADSYFYKNIYDFYRSSPGLSLA